MSKDVNQETEALNNHVAFSQSLLADQVKCTQSPEHSLIHWLSTDGLQSTGDPALLIQQQQVNPNQQQQPQQHQTSVVNTGYNMRV